MLAFPFWAAVSYRFLSFPPTSLTSGFSCGVACGLSLVSFADTRTSHEGSCFQTPLFLGVPSGLAVAEDDSVVPGVHSGCGLLAKLARRSLVEQAAANLLAGRIETLAYDKAADDGKVHALLHEYGITPVIELRSQWQNQREKLVPGQERRGNIVYTENGTVLCINTKGRPGQPLDPDHNAAASLHPARLAIQADHIPDRTVSP